MYESISESIIGYTVQVYDIHSKITSYYGLYKTEKEALESNVYIDGASKQKYIIPVYNKKEQKNKNNEDKEYEQWKKYMEKYMIEKFAASVR